VTRAASGRISRDPRGIKRDPGYGSAIVRPANEVGVRDHGQPRENLSFSRDLDPLVNRSLPSGGDRDPFRIAIETFFASRVFHVKPRSYNAKRAVT
jgi:hypothetical protein